jgi:hypothetical protein
MIKTKTMLGAGRKAKVLAFAFLLTAFLGAGNAFAQSSYISGFNAAGDGTRTDSASLGADDDVTVYVDWDNGGAGSFRVVDQNMGSPVTIINADSDNTNLSSTNTNVSGALNVTGTTTTNGINNGGDGISNAGAVSGVTTLDASGLASLDGGIDVNSNFTVATNGNVSTNGTLNANGATTLNSTLDVDGATSFHSTLSIDGNLTATGATNTIGAAGSNNTLTGATNTLNASSANVISSTVINRLTSDINLIGNAATYAGSTEAIAVDGGTGVNIKGATFNVNTDSAVATTNTIGNTNAATTVEQHAGNSSVEIAQNSAFIGVDTPTAGRFAANATTASVTAGTVNTNSGLSNGITAYNATQTVATAGLDNGTAASRALVNGNSYVSRIQGDTLVDGDTTINGNVAIAAANSVTGTVTGGASNLSGGSATHTSIALANRGEAVTHSSFDSYGNIVMTSAAATEASTSLTLTNGNGVTNGIAMSETRTTMSGGTTGSTLLTLDDNAATFARNGKPVKVTGVADGVDYYDAVNVHQLKQAFSGIASVAALAAIPGPNPEDKMSVGMGVGHFRGQNAMAVGVKGRVLDNLTVSAGLGYGSMDSAITSNAGFSFSW